jgi:hypothetical protein
VRVAEYQILHHPKNQPYYAQVPVRCSSNTSKLVIYDSGLVSHEHLLLSRHVKDSRGQIMAWAFR